jgi:O-antigen ligase
MPTFSFVSIKKNYLKNRLKFLELTFLSLFLAFLPTFEAPKNIFLVSYLITALFRQSQLPKLKWTIWDWIFLSLICSSFLSSLFPFIAGGAEWKGFRGILLWVTFGWTISRSRYNFQEKKYLFIFAIFMTFPSLIWGLLKLLILQTRDSLILHSVGHVNHSAIYLCMMTGSSFAFLFSQFHILKKRYVLLLTLISIFLLSSVVISQSRGAFGILILLIFSIALLSKLSVKIKMLFLSLISFFLICIIFIRPVAVIEKHIRNQENHDVLAHRDKVWELSLEYARLNPIFGLGGGNMNRVEADQIKSSIESRGGAFNTEDFIKFSHPHNIYLANLVDRGILGLIIFLNFMIIWIITLIKSYKKFNQDSKNILFVMGSFSAWISISGIGFVNTTFHHENALLALFFLGLHLSILRQNRIN